MLGSDHKHIHVRTSTFKWNAWSDDDNNGTASRRRRRRQVHFIQISVRKWYNLCIRAENGDLCWVCVCVSGYAQHVCLMCAEYLRHCTHTEYFARISCEHVGRRRRRLCVSSWALHVCCRRAHPATGLRRLRAQSDFLIGRLCSLSGGGCWMVGENPIEISIFHWKIIASIGLSRRAWL